MTWTASFLFIVFLYVVNGNREHAGVSMLIHRHVNLTWSLCGQVIGKQQPKGKACLAIFHFSMKSC